MKPGVIKLAAAVLLLLLTGCGRGPGDVVVDPGGAGPMPTQVPAAPGTVQTRGVVTVMDTGTPELCLGPIAESYPPQCGGPEITNWVWNPDDADAHEQGAIRWGEYALTGRFDGVAFTATDVTPASAYTAPARPTPTPPPPSRTYSPDELAAIQAEAGTLPGAQGAYATDRHVFVDVLYDDGSLQRWADDVYGEHVVLVTAQLVDVP